MAIALGSSLGGSMGGAAPPRRNHSFVSIARNQESACATFLGLICDVGVRPGVEGLLVASSG